MVIECPNRTWHRVTRPRWTVVTCYTNCGCLRSSWTVIPNNTFIAVCLKPPSCFIKVRSLGAANLFWTIRTNAQAGDTISDVGGTVMSRAAVTCLMNGLLQTVFPSSTHGTVINTFTIEIWVKRSNRTRDFSWSTYK